VSFVLPFKATGSKEFEYSITAVLLKLLSNIIKQWFVNELNAAK
jgi:hypothetical protein